ncbi:aldo-keto reductase family 1 member C15-like isoform X3 [Hyperolius riggenbachi]|uniref:aldo-keto reductase family 1 member C15-like isoform X3 n=1 Tax=Hyperolius riggenbachi TaxID=752182 RepID=UPI0035A2C2E3
MDLQPNSVLAMNSGHNMPVIGFGTYAPEKFPRELAVEATKVAIDIGYRHIDGAYIYGNEAEVGRAIREKIADGTVRREGLFCTGKPGDDPFPKDDYGQYIFHNTDLQDTWEAMEQCVDAGLTRSIGVSNFNHKQLELILNKPGLRHKPVCNQVTEVECHIYLNQKKLLEFCRSRDILLVGYSVLGSSRDEKWMDQNAPVVLEDPVLVSIASKHKKSPAQVAIRFFLQLGVVVLAKSFSTMRIKENFQVFDFSLPPEDMKKLEALDRNYRYVAAREFIEHPGFPFHEEF